MRLIFLLFALVAAVTAVPQLHLKAANVDKLKIQRDVVLLLDQVFGEIRDLKLRKFCMDYDIKANLQNYRDQGVVKYMIRAVNLGFVQRKGVPFTTSISNLRKEVAVLTRVFLTAKDYDTFIKTAAWARCRLNEAQFVKAFVAACLQRVEIRDHVVLPAPYEVFPYYYFDSRLIRKAQDIRTRCLEKTETKKYIEIPADYTSWLPKGKHDLAYFTNDIGLNAHYAFFSLAGWMMPAISELDDTTGKNFDCVHCEIGRGAQYYYMHQQLLARYDLERLSNNLWPIKDVDFTHLRTPFKPYLSYPNGLEFPGRHINYDMLIEKKELMKNVLLIERRLKDAIDSGFAISTQGSLLALYNRKGMDILGTLIEGTGKSINPRFYGTYQGAARELLGGAPFTPNFWYPTPSALEIFHTATRDPVFYELYKRIILLFKRYQDSLPMYKHDDLLFDGVKIESVKFDKLVTFCEKFKVDIDSATRLSMDKENVMIKAVVDRLNHKPFTYEIVVNSDKLVKDAVVRVYIGPKYDHEGRYVHIEDNRLRFIELDQFLWDLKEGKTVILRKSKDAPMRSFDFDTKKDLLHKIENAMNSREPFYTPKIPQMYGFPERLALPKGKRDGLTLQVVVMISPPTLKTMTYGPVLSEKYQTYHRVNFADRVGGDWMKKTWFKDRLGSGEEFRDFYHSGENMDTYKTRDTKFFRTTRSADRFSDEVRDTSYERDIKTSGEMHHLHADSAEHHMVDTMDRKIDYLNDYYKDKHIYEKIGGFVSFDGRPLGYPFDRPLSMGCLWIPNVKVIHVNVYHEKTDGCMIH